VKIVISNSARVEGTRDIERLSGGFSLIELMVVVVLMAVMTALIIPEMRGTFEEALLRANARKMVSACNLAYARSISLNKTISVRVNPKGSGYLVEAEPGTQDIEDNAAPAGDSPESKGDLDSRVTVKIRRVTPSPAEPGGEEPPPAEEETGKTDVIRFHPNGTADAAEIVLRDRQGFELLLRVSPATGRVNILDPPKARL
jgi:type II secretion system protein H